mgnify:CR=1 FL=1
MRNYISLLFILFLLSCRPGTPVMVGGVKVSIGLKKEAAERGFDYTGHLAKALAGEEPSMGEMLSYSLQVGPEHTGAHGQVLAGLLERVGDDVFSKKAAVLSEDAKRAVWAAMESGGAKPLQSAAPLTLEALLPAKDIRPYRGLYFFDPQESIFRDCGEPGSRYWVVDETGNMVGEYRRLLRSPYPGQPVVAEVSGYVTPYFGDKKLPAKCTGFLIVTETGKFEVKNFRNTCIPYDYWALGTEPFWQAQISAGEGLIEYRGMDDERWKVFPFLSPVEEDTARVFAAINQETGDNIRISLKETPCSDGMSDRSYRFAVQLTVNGKNLSGCGIAYEDRALGEE